MSFDKPQPLVHAPGNLGEQVRRVGVLKFRRLVNREANLATERR